MAAIEWHSLDVTYTNYCESHHAMTYKTYCCTVHTALHTQRGPPAHAHTQSAALQSCTSEVVLNDTGL